MRSHRTHRSIITLIPVLTLVLFSLLQSSNAQLLDTPRQAETTEIDVCKPLYEAQAILRELQPGPYEHLDKKLKGTLPSLGSRGWGEGLGWNHDGPLSTTFRLLPRLIQSLLSPGQLLGRMRGNLRIPFFGKSGRKGGDRVGKGRKGKIEKMWWLLDEGEKGGCGKVGKERGKLGMFPPKGITQDLPASFEAYSKYLDTNSDPDVQFLVGVFYATGLAGIKEDQGKAILYYTFAALQGYRPAQMALGYRHWAGIGVKEDCMTALGYYESAAEQSYSTYLSGPPGGLTFPLTPTRLTDRLGGLYGPHASWASSNHNSFRASIKSALASSRGETETEILEYYQYHSDRDSPSYAIRLGRLYYLGSVYPIAGGVGMGGEGCGELGRDYGRAWKEFVKVGRVVWPVDVLQSQRGGGAGLKGTGDGSWNGKWGGLRKAGLEVVGDNGRAAAGYLGRMLIRGEGIRVDYERGRMWFERAAELGDRESWNGLGIIHRDGLGVPVDKTKAFNYFTAAAGQDLAEAQINLAKIHLERGEIIQATQFLEASLRHASSLEAFHLLSRLHSRTARLQSSLPSSSSSQPGICGVSVAWFKLVSERGSWVDDFTLEGDKAWGRGEEEKAVVAWLVGGEMGGEVAQNDLGLVLGGGGFEGLFKGRNGRAGREVGKKEGEGEAVGKGEMDAEREGREGVGRDLRWWVRSGGQDNVDALVKVGDMYYSGEALPQSPPTSKTPHETALQYYQSAADYQTSSLAYWNLGWMYEMGKGVPRDWHLAKRYYDLCGEVSPDAWIGVGVSLVGLYVRSWWIDLKTGGAVPGLSLFENDELVETDHTTPKTSFWSDLKGILHPPGYVYDAENEAGGLDVGDYHGAGSGWTEGGNDRDGWDAEGLDDEEFMETLVIFGLGGLIMFLFWVRGRWAGWEAERRERERRDGGVAGQPGGLQQQIPIF